MDTRWGQAFEGIITTVRGPDGWLLTADEDCHLSAGLLRHRASD